jgi:dienelactone hydrolase
MGIAARTPRAARCEISLYRAISLLAPALLLLAAPAPAQPALTCDPAQLAPDSYRLTTEAPALILAEQRISWWDAFHIERIQAAAEDLNSEVAWAAEAALRIDPRNLVAHGHLARQYLVLGRDAEATDAEWQATLDGGGAIVWTSTWRRISPM